MRPELRRHLKPSAVHSYGFRARSRCQVVTALVRQLLFLAYNWNMPLLVAVQDVRTAFDAMQHAHIALALEKRGVDPGLVAANLRELSGIQDYITLPGVGDSAPFLYTRGGKQGGVETPDQWNAFVDYVLESVAISWASRSFGFRIEGSESESYYVTHAFWCDNFIIFARDQVMLSIMIQEMTSRIHAFDLQWKASSLEIMPAGSFAEAFEYEFEVVQDGGPLRYKLVSEMLLLGEMLNNHGDTSVSVAYRQSLANAAYYRHRDAFQSRCNVALKLKAWTATPAAVALHGCESWHVTSSMMQSFQTWEFQMLRKVFKMHRKPLDSADSYNKRTAATLRRWFTETNIHSCTHRILRSVFKDAWNEKFSLLPCGDHPLQMARETRSQLWWQTVCFLETPYMRHKSGLQQRSQGHRPAWEDIFCKCMGIHWRQERDLCKHINSWMQKYDEFEASACDLLNIWHQGKPSIPVSFVDTSRNCLATFLDVPSLATHPAEHSWDSGCKRLWLQVDCKGIADIMGGRAVLQAPHLELLFRRMCDSLLFLCASDWKPKQDVEDIVIWSPRQYNIVADHLVNAAMDNNCDWDWEDAEAIQQCLNGSSCPRVCVDSGYRRPSDMAAIGVAVFTYDSKYIPLRYAARLLQDVRSAFQSEAHALDLALEILRNLI